MDTECIASLAIVKRMGYVTIYLFILSLNEYLVILNIEHLIDVCKYLVQESRYSLSNTPFLSYAYRINYINLQINESVLK